MGITKPQKLPSGRWRVRVTRTISGKRVVKSFNAATRYAAETLAAQYAAGRIAQNSLGITVRECLETYIATKEPVLSPNTIRGYKTMLRNLYPVDLLGTPLINLTATRVQNWISNLTTKCAPKTVHNAYALLSAAIALSSPSTPFSITLPQKRRTGLYTPSDEDVRTLLESAEGYLKSAIILAAFGPLRSGEICALEHSDINRKTGAVSVTKSLALQDGGGWIVKPPKTAGSNRVIMFDKAMLSQIPKGKGRVCPVQPVSLNKAFMRLLKKCGLPAFRFHDLRHYCASVLHAIGIPDQYIMERGGWSSPYVMQRVYRNTIDSFTETQNAKAFEHFGKLLEK